MHARPPAPHSELLDNVSERSEQASAVSPEGVVTETNPAVSSVDSKKGVGAMPAELRAGAGRRDVKRDGVQGTDGVEKRDAYDLFRGRGVSFQVMLVA